MFKISRLIPLPLKEQNIGYSEIWNSDLEINFSDKIFISAPSGKGKTTFQMILYGIRKDYEGAIFLDNQPLRNISLDEWSDIRQRRLSIIFQDLRLFPNLTALENIQLKNSLCNHKSETQIYDMAERLSVADFLHKKSAILSYGQRQRMAIIRAMCQPFEMLLMDEPFSHLDAENIKKACELINDECEQQGAGFMIASLGENYALPFNREINL